MSANQFTTTSINDAASTGGFASLSSPSSHAGGAASASSESTPIAPSTLNALDSTSTTTGSGATHIKYSEPNIPATAQDLAAKAPSGDEIQQKSHQYIDQAAQLAAQAKTQAGELVAPKDKDELNSTEAHIDSVTRGIAGMLATAPLAGIEKISPVVAQKLDNAAQSLAAQYHSTVEPAAGQYAQQASDAVRNYLPASLGGKATTGTTTGTTTTDGTTLGEKANAAAQAYLPESVASKLPGAASTESVTTTTDGTTGPTVTEQASSALNSASQSASSTANSATQSAQSALNSATQSARSTADAYLPESVSSKIPGTGAAAGSSSVDSPYVPLSQDKPTSTLPSTAAKGQGADSALVSDFSSGTGTSKQFSGLEPATTAQLPASSTTSVEKPTQGAPMYTQAASGDYKTDQTAFAPAEYAAEKHQATSNPLPSSSSSTTPEVEPIIPPSAPIPASIDATSTPTSPPASPTKQGLKSKIGHLLHRKKE